LKGWRGTQEDTIIIHKNYRGEKGFSIYGVFDGHRGSETSEFCAITFARYFNEIRNKRKHIRISLKKTFKRIQKYVSQSLCLESGKSYFYFFNFYFFFYFYFFIFIFIFYFFHLFSQKKGSTAAVAVVIDNVAYTANLGDARITLGRQNGKKFKKKIKN
jgi:serine/threonine protein phosphatase PrpC